MDMDYVGKQVKLLLQSGIIIDGIVISWSGNSVCLTSLDGNSTSIITHPNEDIRVIKIIHKNYVSSNSINKSLNNIPDKETIVKNLQDQFDVAYQLPSDDSLRIKTMAELKKELIKQEKEIIANKLRSHHIGEVRTVKYEQPGFFKKQGAK